MPDSMSKLAYQVVLLKEQHAKQLSEHRQRILILEAKIDAMQVRLNAMEQQLLDEHNRDNRLTRNVLNKLNRAYKQVNDPKVAATNVVKGEQ